jgi:hypothetical protein
MTIMAYGGLNREHRRGTATRALACEDCTSAEGLPAVRGHEIFTSEYYCSTTVVLL